MPANQNNQTLKLKNVDFNRLIFSDKKETKNPKGTDNVFLSYGDTPEATVGKWLYIQFPSGLRHPFDYNLNDDGSMSITLSLDKGNTKHREAIDKLKAFDDAVFQKLSQNSRPWLKKPSIDDSWRNSDKFVKFLKVKEMENDEGEMEERYYNIKLKLPVKDGKLTTIVYDSDMKEVDPKEYLVPHCTIEPIARPSRLWFQKTGKVGTTWECAYLRVKRTDTTASQGKIFDDSEDEDDAAAPANEATDDVTETVAGMTIEDEDDESPDTDTAEATVDADADAETSAAEPEEAAETSPAVKKGGRKAARGKAT